MQSARFRHLRFPPSSFLRKMLTDFRLLPLSRSGETRLARETRRRGVFDGDARNERKARLPFAFVALRRLFLVRSFESVGGRERTPKEKPLDLCPTKGFVSLHDVLPFPPPSSPSCSSLFLLPQIIARTTLKAQSAMSNTSTHVDLHAREHNTDLEKAHHPSVGASSAYPQHQHQDGGAPFGFRNLTAGGHVADSSQPGFQASPRSPRSSFSPNLILRRLLSPPSPLWRSNDERPSSCGMLTIFLHECRLTTGELTRPLLPRLLVRSLTPCLLSFYRRFANPAPLGLCAFALTTFMLSLINGALDVVWMLLRSKLTFSGFSQSEPGESVYRTSSPPLHSRTEAWCSSWLAVRPYFTFPLLFSADPFSSPPQCGSSLPATRSALQRSPHTVGSGS